MPKSLTDLQVFNNIEAESTVTANTIALKTDNSTAPSYGQIAWNAVERTFDIGMGNGVVGQALREMHYPPVINNTGVTIPDGTPVGAVGYDVTNQKIEIAPFIADGTYPSYLFLGLTTEEIVNGAVGLVTHFGDVNNIDTSSFTPFSTIYVSDTVAGQLVSVAPISPSQKIGIGVVTVSNASLGSIFVRPILYPKAVDITYDDTLSHLISSNVQSAIDELSFTKASVESLSSNVQFYSTSANSDIVGYYKMVTSTEDPDYNAVAVNIPTGSLTTTDKLIASLVADSGIFIGNPGVINVSTIGNIAKTAGNNNAYGEFYFKVFHRTSAGVETLITTSNTTGVINPTILNAFSTYNASAILNNGNFTETDRVVIKFYGSLVTGVNPAYSFQFGGDYPVRTLFPVPVSVIPSDYAADIRTDTSQFNAILSGADSSVQSALETLDNHLHDSRYTQTSLLTTVGTTNTTSGASRIGIYDEFSLSSGTSVQSVINDLDASLFSHIGSTGASHGVATTSVNGFMSSADKTKLDTTTASATTSSIAMRDSSGKLVATDITITDNNLDLGNLHNDLQHNGIPESEKSKWTLSYNATTRVVTLTLSSASYYYVNGKRFDLATGVHTWTAHTNTSGLYFFYFNSSGVKQISNTTWDLLNTAQVATVVYNSANDGGSPAGILENEMHGMVMSPAMHRYLHISEGTRLISGGGISGYTLGVSTVNAITWTTSDSVIADEDIQTTIPTQIENNYILAYLDATNVLNWRTAQPLPIFTNGTDIQYNQIGVGLTPITSSNTYVNYYVVLTNAVDSAYRTMILPGQQIYNSLEEAQAESPANLNLSYIPFQEYVFLYQITYVRTSGGSTTVGKASIATNPVRQGVSRSIVTGSASDHNLLSNRNTPGAHLAGSIATNDGAFTGILQPALDINVQTALENLSIHALDRNMFNATGDLIYASADNTPAILPVGTNGEVLKLVSGIPSWEPDNNTTYSVGNGLTSSGTIFSMGTPSGLSATTTNATTATSHTHAISTASAVGLSNTSTSGAGTSTSLARADHTHAITGFSLSTHNHDTAYQPLDADLTSIAGLTGTTGFLKKTAANTWSLDTNSYLNLTGGTLTGTLTSRALTPSASATYNIGTSSVKYKDLYLSGSVRAEGGTIGGTLTVNNLTVNGTTTTINSTTVTIDDPVFTLGGDTAPTIDDNKDRGIEYKWHNGTTAKLGFFGYDDSTGYFTFIPDATNTNEVFSGTKGTLDANLNGNASSVTNGVYTTGSYSDPSWLTISKSKVGLSNVENTALSTWAGTTNVTTVGAITATSVNKVTITAPATSAILTIANGKTFTSSNTLTFAGTDGSTLNIGAGGTLASGAFASAYVHPSDGGGSIPTALTGANVVSAITVNSLGHVTGTSTRALAPADIGAATAGHIHTTYDRASSVLTGAVVFSDLTVTDGIVTASATRSLVPADIGAMSTTHAANSITTTNISNWNTAYGWGNHASAGYQPGDADLTAIAGLTGTTGLLKKTAANTWTLDTTAYTTNTGTVTSVAAGAGMDFTTFSTTGSVAMGTPSTITTSTTNSASGTTHTHALTLPSTMPPSSHAITAHTSGTWKTYYSNASSIVELALGASGTYLRSAGTNVAPTFSAIQASDVPTLNQNTTGNASTATTATNLASGASGSIPYQTGAGATTMLPKGADGQVLKLVSGVPAWGSDNNTTYSGSLGITLSGTDFRHSNSVTAGTASEGGTARTLEFGGTFNIPSITYDEQGHITEKGSIKLTMPANPNTNYYPTAFAWAGGTSNGPTGSLTGTGMSAVSFGAIPSASATASGIVTNGDQTFAGNKTFNGLIKGINGTSGIRHIVNNNTDVDILRVSTTDAASAGYGFSFRYLGTGAGNENALALIADNQAGTQVESFRIKQDGTFNTNNQIISTLPTGTSPFAVSSTTVVTNLNADTLDGNHASAFATAGHTHSTYDRASSVLSGNSVFSDITVVDGIVTGTATRSLTKTDISLGNVENTALSTWAGTSNITTVGTLSSGTIPWSLISGEPSTYAPSAHTLDSHSNVTITSNTSGEILKWNGTAWENNTLAEAGIQPAGSYLTTATGFGGDVSGAYNAIVVANDSHTHDTRYYTETESDSRFVNITGDTMTGDLTINGALYSTSKSFRIPHPTKEGKTLTYGSLEGPENGIYVRGKSNERMIRLPDYWEHLVDKDTITVQLTPIGKHQKLIVGEVGNTFVEVLNKKLFSKRLNYYYFIQAERKDIPKLEVEK